MEEKKQDRGKWKQRSVLIALAAIGVMLIFLGNRASLGQQATAPEASEPYEDDLMRYTAMMEQKIVTLCQGIKGVGDVRVIVSFEGDFSYIYATDSEVVEKDGTQSDHSEYVTIGSGNAEQPVLISRTPPPICGIGIVCTGGDDAIVRREITALLSAAFGIGSNKIYVVRYGANS